MARCARSRFVRVELRKAWSLGMDTICRILTSLFDQAKYVVGFADMRGLLSDPYADYPYGISIVRRLDDEVVDQLADGPTRAYLHHYADVNAELNQSVSSAVEQLAACGIECLGVPATLSEEQISEHHQRTLSYDVSHKQVATRSGLGWIGKTDLLVSRRFGTRVRLASILTKHRLEAGTPINESQCGSCSVCVDACPAKAASGALWSILRHRDEFFDAAKCRAYCRLITEERLGVSLSLCGKCLSVCPNWS